VNSKLHWRCYEDVSPSALCNYIFLVPVAYATGKYVSPSGLRNQAVMLGSGLRNQAVMLGSGLRNQAVMLGSGFTQLAGDRLHRIVLGNSERMVSAGVD